MRHIQVKRGDRLVTELDLYDFLAKGDKSADVKLQDGDTIVIPPAKDYVALTGKVSEPAVYELVSDQDTVGSVLSLSGGLPVMADPKRAYLERVAPSKSQRAALKASRWMHQASRSASKAVICSPCCSSRLSLATPSPCAATWTSHCAPHGVKA